MSLEQFVQSPEHRLWRACRDGNIRVVNAQLVKGAELEWEWPAGTLKGVTSLWMACRGCYTDIVVRLLKEGSLTTNTDSLGRSCLWVAAEAGAIHVVRALIKAKADLNAQDQSGQTPLHVALMMKHRTVACILIDAGARIDITDNSGALPLLVACSRGDYHTACQILMKSPPSDVDAQNLNGRTPLHGAAANGYAELVRLLRHQGANPFIRDSRDHTALDLAEDPQQHPRAGAQVECERVLQRYGQKLALACCRIAAKSGRMNQRKALVDQSGAEADNQAAGAITDAAGAGADALAGSSKQSSAMTQLSKDISTQATLGRAHEGSVQNTDDRFEGGVDSPRGMAAIQETRTAHQRGSGRKPRSPLASPTSRGAATSEAADASEDVSDDSDDTSDSDSTVSLTPSERFEMQSVVMHQMIDGDEPFPPLSEEMFQRVLSLL